MKNQLDEACARLTKAIRYGADLNKKRRALLAHIDMLEERRAAYIERLYQEA